MTILTANLIDTNILVYANNKDSEFHSICKSIVEKAIKYEIEAVIAVQNLIELYAVITDKRRVEHPLFPAKAKELIEFYRRSNIRIIAPTPQTIDTITNLIEKHNPKSQSIFDYLLVATMMDNGVYSIYTANSEHFKHFDSITVINPLFP
ncbi:type II toxin-antitoxin system VapC family toxin [Candidatus Hakubella thermalkaliphila]|uniref:type II toxin-antitoxin system VapC family toxin n=1 Tax=Candidatus Hakubella thermalkaliphila TaxID=2754717 RepID=UPI001C613F65|nr:PIN domain-containing protein [Candidatus Hakubella thermalkaliphila]